MVTKYEGVVYINGKFVPAEEAAISVFDHGLLYGDGIFEGIRAYNGRVFRLKEHIDRLFYSAKAILLQIPMSAEEMTAAVVATCRRNKVRDGYIRLVVTRGIGTLGLNPNRCKNPSVIIIAGKIQLYPVTANGTIDTLASVQLSHFNSGTFSRTFQVGVYVPAPAGTNQNQLQGLSSTFGLTWHIDQ